MSIHVSDYRKCVELSERVAWRVEDVVPPGSVLDFTRAFMPSAMFFGHTLDCLNDHERLRLNQIFGNGYRYLFYFVEAYIIDMAMRHATAELYGDENTLRALLRFAEEEVKHQQLFLRFGEMFDAQFGTPCDLVDSPQAVAAIILSRVPMAVVLVTLHLEIITQQHFVDAMRDDRSMEPLFASLFRHHWMEESQHAKLDALELIKLRSEADAAMVTKAVDDYFAIAGAFAGLLANQARLDVNSLERAVQRTFTASERAEIEAAQRRAYNRAFLYDGVTNKQFLEFLTEYFPEALERAAEAARVFA